MPDLTVPAGGPARADVAHLDPVPLDAGLSAMALADPVLCAELEQANLRAHEYLDEAKAESTRTRYEWDWKDWCGWCARYGITPLPAAPQAVALYLGARAHTWAWSTVAGRLAAIAHYHHNAGLPSPTAHPLVLRIRSGIRRVNGVATAGKQPITPGQLAAMVAAVRTDQGRQPLARIRDPAILLLGFYAGRRRSELVAISVNDLTLIDGEGLRIRIRRSKTDQEGRGRTIGVPYSPDPNLCPVRAVLAWCDAAGVSRYLGRRRDRAADVPLFRGLTKHGTLRAGRLTDRWVAILVKDAIARAGLDLDLDDFSGHSLRVGLVSEAVEQGVSPIAIMKQTGHTRLATTSEYARGSLFRDNAAAAIMAAATRDNRTTAGADDLPEGQ